MFDNVRLYHVTEEKLPNIVKTSIIFLKNITFIILCIVTLIGCVPETETINAPASTEKFIDNSSTKCAIDSSSAARTTEYKTSTGLDAICASYAYDAGATGKGQTISVLDTPFFTNHAEFKDDNNVSAFTTGYDASSNSNNIACNEICNSSDGDSNDGTIHGTHVAGVIGARKNTITGSDGSNNMHGVAYEATIKPIAIFARDGEDDTTSDQLINAINKGSGTDIIAMNNSWGANDKSCLTYKGNTYYYTRPPGKNRNNINCEIVTNIPLVAHLNAWEAGVNNGTIMVFANGNDGLNSQTGIVPLYNNSDFLLDDYPDQIVSALTLFGSAAANVSSYEGMFPEYRDALKGKWISVIAVDENNNIASFSNGCGVAKDYCLAAPGNFIWGPTETKSALLVLESHSWAALSGTSLAAPHVSGAIALLKDAYPSMSSEEIVSLLFVSATDLGAPGTDEVYGRGMLNLQAAFKPIGELTAVTTDNQSLGVPLNDTSLTLANHFGTQIHDIEIGIRDNYNRSFTASPTKIYRAPIAITLNDYIQSFTSHQAETYTLTPQTKVNYQADASEIWMKLIYDYGDSTASVAFHDNLQPNTLSDASKQKIQSDRVLRAFAIRPAGTNIAKMNVAHRLNSRVTLSSYAAKGNYDTGHDFNELATDINYQNNRLILNIGIGHLREYQQFLGTQGTGAYALDGASLSQFTDINISHKLHKNSKFSAFANYTLYQTNVDMRYQQFVEITNLQADHSKIGITGADIISDDDNLTISLNTALGVTDGTLVQYTVLGYNDDGSYHNVSNRYDLAVENRHQQFAILYQGKRHNRSERNIPLFSENRFFTKITYDKHFQHQQDVTQISIISGISAEF